MLVGMYFPPRPGGPKQAQKYRATVDALFKRLEKTLQAAAGRTMPLTGMDLNDNLGLQKQGRWWQPSFDRHVGRFMPGQEHYASQELRKLMLQYEFAAQRGSNHGSDVHCMEIETGWMVLGEDAC